MQARIAVHDHGEAEAGGQRRTIPTSIGDYNKNMGGVDRIDQLLEPYDATRKTVQWYVKLAIHLNQIAVLNGWTLYKHRGGSSQGTSLTILCSEMVYRRQRRPRTAHRPTFYI
ncbi:PiggyBac transposable element-derived protein 4 [Elysia marginata]|uniref:PiggyBac transposable element-derived protein 4 n=1 Tax=Elysia marginata TaxID=1093978 RepID=A0AAV4HKC4_9GAST|nr:PiggyBac transposable element-derived protein 4 [Elysia marginata]